MNKAIHAIVCVYVEGFSMQSWDILKTDCLNIMPVSLDYLEGQDKRNCQSHTFLCDSFYYKLSFLIFGVKELSMVGLFLLSLLEYWLLQETLSET